MMLLHDSRRDARFRDGEMLHLDEYRYLHAASAELLHRLGRNAEAAVAYHRALELVRDDVERRQFQRRLQQINQPTAATGVTDGRRSNRRG
jgi:RNA polymerase sigma-70 factor, ECF subfamily